MLVFLWKCDGNGPATLYDRKPFGLRLGLPMGRDFIGNVKGLQAWRCRMVIFHWKYEGVGGLEMQNVDISLEI